MIAENDLNSNSLYNMAIVYYWIPKTEYLTGPLGYERGYLPLSKMKKSIYHFITNTPFHIQVDELEKIKTVCMLFFTRLYLFNRTPNWRDMLHIVAQFDIIHKAYIHYDFRSTNYQ